MQGEKMNVIMEPALWGTLPNEILFLVFARLPVFGINQLRVLSKDWKREVETPDTEFNRVLEGAGYPACLLSFVAMERASVLDLVEGTLM